MTESAAIMIYLADLYPAAGLAPSVTSPLRPRYLRWMLYFATGVYMADLRLFYPARHSTDASHSDAIKAKATEDMERDFDIFAEALGEGPFILGPSMSAVDIYAAMLISWAPEWGSFLRAITISRDCMNWWQRGHKLQKSGCATKCLKRLLPWACPIPARGKWHIPDRRG